MRRTLPIAFLLPLLLISCHRNPDNTLHRVDQSVTSWSATLALVREDLSANRVTRTYVLQTLDAARADLDQERQLLSAVPPRDPRRRTVQYQLDTLRRAIDDLGKQLAGGPS